MPIRHNVLANLVGRLWAALMSFAFVPLYIRLLGIEAYGLIGLFASMMAMFALLDLGLSLTANRELARAADRPDGIAAARDLLRTLEVAYWLIAVAIGIAIFLAAPLIVDHWLHVRTLDRQTVVGGVRAMAVTALMRWPVSLYFGALTGLQRQVSLNVVLSVGATLASAGVVAVLALVSRTVTAFFLWQALVAGVQVLLLRRLAWHHLRLPDHRPRVGVAAVRASVGFSAAITALTLLSIVLTQLDKVILSRMLPLDVFGRYALCSAIAAVLTTMGTAVESAVFPALSRLVARGDGKAERRLYHQASQGLALLIVPATTGLVVFAQELLGAYVHDAAIVASTYRLLSLLAAGSGVLALMYMPLSLQLAHGWTSLSLVKNLVAVILFAPLLYVLILYFGALGAGGAWLILTAGYFLVEVPVMHHRLLPGEQWRWYAVDIGIPTAVAVAAFGALRLAMPAAWPLSLQVPAIGLAYLVAVGGSAMLMPECRRIIAAWRNGAFAGRQLERS